MLLRPPPAPAAAAGRFMPLGKGKNKQEQCKGKNKQELCKGKNKQQLCRKCHCCNEGHRRNNDNTMEPLLRDCPSHRYRFQNTSSDGNLQSVFLNWPRKYSDTVGVMYFSHSSRMALPLLNCQSSVLTSVSLSSFGGGGGGGDRGEREREKNKILFLQNAGACSRRSGGGSAADQRWCRRWCGLLLLAFLLLLQLHLGLLGASIHLFGHPAHTFLL